MKRHSGRDHSPRTKRSRHSHTPDLSPHGVFDRHSQIDGSSQRSRQRHSPSPHNEHRDGSSRRSQNASSNRETYKSLCVSSLPSKISDAQVKEAIQKYYSQFGDLNIKFATYNNERVAYINFKHSDIAQKARHTVIRFEISDRPVRVEPVCSARNRSPTPRTVNNNSRSRNIYDNHSNDRVSSPPSGRPDSLERGSGSGGKREPKFPHHLDHKDPSEDPTATRTLFVGNLYYEINEAEIRDIFEPYGIVEDVDIKRPTKGSGNAYAFIKYWNLDMAHRAKIAMSGKVVKNFQCKIGYGKANPTRCIWVGGLGPWIQFETLKLSFSEYGDIETIEWPQGKNYAYILYLQIDAAISACNSMRGRSLSNTENKLRIDFAEPEHILKDPLVRRRTTTGGSLVANQSSVDDNRRRISRDREDRSVGRSRRELSSVSRDSEDRHSRDNVRSTVHSHSTRLPPTLQTSKTMSDLISCLPEVWAGWYVLKACLFPCSMHLLHGNGSLVKEFLFDPRIDTEEEKKEEVPKRLNITQRLPLEQSKIEDFHERMKLCGVDHSCILVATTCSEKPACDSNETSRMFKSLVTYFLRKEAAGVVFLPGTDDTCPGVLHCFPPCDFARDILSQNATTLQMGRLKNDYLVVVLIRNVSMG